MPLIMTRICSRRDRYRYRICPTEMQKERPELRPGDRISLIDIGGVDLIASATMKPGPDLRASCRPETRILRTQKCQWNIRRICPGGLAPMKLIIKTKVGVRATLN
jgi:hypothetical protein